MFEDFDKKKSSEGRGRRGVSAVLSIGVFGGLALAVGGAITAHQVHRQRVEREQQVTFADLPTIQAPKPKTLVEGQGGQEGDRATAAAGGPQGDPDRAPRRGGGRAGDGRGHRRRRRRHREEGAAARGAGAASPAPAQARAGAAAAPSRSANRSRRRSFVSGCRAPEVPNALLSNAATIRIEVEMMIDESGKVVSARVVQSNPLIPDDVVLACANAQLFEPAHLPDGTAVPYPFRRRFVFKPAQA